MLRGDLASAGHGARVLALLPRRRRRDRRAARRERSRPRPSRARAGRCSSRSRRSSRRRRSCSPTAAGPAAAIRATGASASGARRPGAPPSGRCRGTGPGTFLAATRVRQLNERPVPDALRARPRPAGMGRARHRRPAGRLAWYLAVGRLVSSAPWPRPAGAPRRGRRERLASWLLSRRRRVPAREPARLALGAHRRRSALGARRRRPARIAPIRLHGRVTNSWRSAGRFRAGARPQDHDRLTSRQPSLLDRACSGSAARRRLVAAPAIAGETKPVVKAGQAGGKSVVVNSRGRTLYVLTPETAKHLLCIGGCLSAWPPAEDREVHDAGRRRAASRASSGGSAAAAGPTR